MSVPARTGRPRRSRAAGSRPCPAASSTTTSGEAVVAPAVGPLAERHAARAPSRSRRPPAGPRRPRRCRVHSRGDQVGAPSEFGPALERRPTAVTISARLGRGAGSRGGGGTNCAALRRTKATAKTPAAQTANVGRQPSGSARSGEREAAHQHRGRYRGLLDAEREALAVERHLVGHEQVDRGLATAFAMPATASSANSAGSDWAAGRRRSRQAVVHDAGPHRRAARPCAPKAARRAQPRSPRPRRRRSPRSPRRRRSRRGRRGSVARARRPGSPAGRSRPRRRWPGRPDETTRPTDVRHHDHPDHA